MTAGTEVDTEHLALPPDVIAHSGGRSRGRCLEDVVAGVRRHDERLCGLDDVPVRPDGGGAHADGRVAAEDERARLREPVLLARGVSRARSADPCCHQGRRVVSVESGGGTARSAEITPRRPIA